MSDTSKTDADLKLIKLLFSIEPLDYARREDGTLVIIHPDGKKTKHSPEEIAELSAKEITARTAAPPPGKKPASERASGEASRDARLSADSVRSTGGPKQPVRAPDAPAPPAGKKPAAAGADD